MPDHNNQLLLSIVIPTYNRAKYLERCLESIVCQQGDYYEIVVSDNASPDNTQEVMQKYITDRRIHYYRNEKNLGARENIFKATKLAQGEYVFWLTDDDYLLPNSLSKVFEVIKANSQLGYLYSPFKTINDITGDVYCEYQNFSVDTFLEGGIQTISQVLPATWVFSRQIIKTDLIDWVTWEKYKENAYIMAIVVGRILLKSPAYYLASDLISHTYLNQVYWEEFGETDLDIKLYTNVSIKNCMRSVFYDQQQTQEIRQVIKKWEDEKFIGWLQNEELGFYYLLKIRGVKQSILWTLKHYNLDFRLGMILLKFIVLKKFLLPLKLKAKSIIK